MELRHKKLQQQLVDLGYNYTIKSDSVLLVEKLVEDLIETTKNLRKYMKIAQDAVEERETLKFGAEPYKCDNAKLTQQCNDLHLALIDVKEQHSKEQKDFKKKITQFENDRQDFIESNKKQRERIRELELDAVRKSTRHSHSQHVLQGCKSKSTSNIGASKKTKNDIDSAMALTEQKVSNLSKEICKLKQQQLELCSINDELKQKLNHREKEIQRLNRMLEGGRPLDALNNDCCYQDVQMKLLNKQDEITYLQKANGEMEMKLKDARNKQHEAMKHALHLAERNSQLEKELRDIDQMALVVEQECNDSIKTNDAKVKKLQERLHSSMMELQTLEKELQSLRIEREQFRADLDASNIEKRHLQGVLEGALEDKKRLTDRFNNFTIIENDLNEEIDRLVRQTADQTRTIADLKGQLLAQKAAYSYDSGNELPRMRSSNLKSPPLNRESRKSSAGKQLKENKKPMAATKARSPPPTKSKRKSSFSTRTGNRSPEPQLASFLELNLPYSSEANNYMETNGSGMNKNGESKTSENTERNNHKTCKNNDCEYLNRIKSERDFYVREYKALMEKIRKDGSTERLNYNLNISNMNENYNSIMQTESVNNGSNNQARELKEQLTQLKHENQNLAKEKHNLLSRLENVRDYSDATEYLTLKATSKRLERERDILKADVDRLQEERDSIKHRIKISADLHSSEIERYKKLLNENDEQLRKMENERYDILQNHGSRRATVTNLEDQCDTLKEQLKSSNDELIRHKTIYSQLKILHEQTDRALADSQNQLLHLEKQLGNYEQKHNAFDNKTTTLNNDIHRLKDDIDLLTKNLVDVEREKDNLLLQLDEKTERIVSLEDQLQSKNNDVEQMRQQTSDLRHKFTATVDERNSKDSQLKCKSNDITQLRRDLEAALKSKENLVQENKRIQDELSSCLLDNRKVHCELEVAKRQIVDLTMQLQHYCAEVKRIEDMMTQKEVERGEMLDQFRNLSHEATTLENNNHSLENAATQSKVQLSVALGHAGELEQIIAQQRSLITNYEKQISELSSQMATLEMQVKHGDIQHERAKLELTSLRELCAKLDKQKDDLHRQVSDRDYATAKAESELQMVKRHSELANMTLEKEQTSARSLGTLLSETREALVEQRLINEDLHNEIDKLKEQVTDMESNLTIANERLDIYQEKALDYSQQNKQLRRDIVNERYTQSKDDPTQRYPLKVRMLARDLCLFFDNTGNLSALNPELRATFQNLYETKEVPSLPQVGSQDTTIPSEMIEFSENPQDNPMYHCICKPDESESSSPITANINIQEFKQQIEEYNNNLRYRNVRNDKICVTKVKVTSFSQTNKGDYKRN